MNDLFRPAPLSAPARLVQPCEPILDTFRPYPRSLEEAFGPDRAHGPVFPMADPQAMHPSDALVARASAWCGVVVVVLLVAEHLNLL